MSACRSSKPSSYDLEQCPVVQKVDNAILQINRHPADKC